MIWIKYFLVQDGVLRASNQLLRYWQQYGAVRAGCPRSSRSYWINNFSSVISLQEVTAHFSSCYTFLQHALLTNAISNKSFRLCREFLGESSLQRRLRLRGQGRCISFRTATVFKWKLQAVQTTWHCERRLIMTNSPLPWVLIKNSSFSSLSLSLASEQNWGNGPNFRLWHSCRICYHFDWDQSHFLTSQLRLSWNNDSYAHVAWVQPNPEMNSVGFLGISVFLNSSFSLLDVILNAVNLLLKEKCSQNQIITFVFCGFFIYPLGVTGGIHTLPFSVLMNQYLWSFCRRCNWLGRCAATGKQIKIVRVPFKTCTENNGGFTR